jgi:tRNA modification GTPase
MTNHFSDNICALATANAFSAIGVIRCSGAQSIGLVNQIFKGPSLEKAASHTVHYGFLMDGPEAIDEVMVSLFRAPKSFTTEDSVEISFHGSPFIAKRILELLIDTGFRMAKAGEFSMRAFLNGRIDLAQAESVADLIAAENDASRKLALQNLKGGISQEIKLLRNDLLNFISYIELELDFSEEDVQFADRTALQKLLHTIAHKLQQLYDSFKYGNAIKNGVNVAIIGQPNAGKSTLLNALLKEERAIVSSIAGTTRDSIEEVLSIEGHAFRLIDTAGLRDTTDEIEAIGVKIAKEKVSKAQILVYLADANQANFDADFEQYQALQRPDLYSLFCFTKMDQSPQAQALQLIETQENYLGISAKNQLNLEGLKQALLAYVHQLKTSEDNHTVANQRHYEAIAKSLESIALVNEAIDAHYPTELLAYELRAATEHMGSISGDVSNDEVLGNIFSKFCIGK